MPHQENLPASPRTGRRRRLILITAAAGLALLLGWLVFGGKAIDRTRVYTITYGTDMPFHYRGPDGGPQGLAVELVSEAARRAGIKLKWVYNGDSRNNDLLVLQTIRPELLNRVRFSAPYLQTLTWFVVPSESSIKSAADLQRARISFVDYGIHRTNLARLLPAMQAVPASTSREALEHMMEGHADAAYVNEYALLPALLVGKVSPGLRIIPSDAPKSLMALSTSPQFGPVVDAIRGQMGSMVDDGTIPRLISSWGWFANLTSDMVTELVTAERRNRWIQTSLGALSLVLLGGVLLAIRSRNQAVKLSRAEASLREQAALLNLANEAIFVLTLDHVVKFWNEGATRLYGWTSAEILGRRITEIGLVDLESFHAAHANLLAHGNCTHETRKTGKDGRMRVVFCRWTLLRDRHGRPKDILAINTDVTEKKQLEQNYLRAQRMEGIGMLAGGIAHDLNNILTPVLLSTSLLRESERDPENLELLDSMRASAQRGSDIIQQLLTFARGQPSVRAPVPVRQLLREMEKLIRETFPRNIRGTARVPAELWTVVGDATQVHQALMNLCVNARDAMPEGGTVTLSVENVELDAEGAARVPDARPGPHVRLSVTDTGTGMTAGQMEHIFDPFFTTKEVGKGTGLGLPTVLGIVRGHGGAVRVESRPGQGTTFELYLPASPAEKCPDAPAEHKAPRGQGQLVLVVDDEATIRDTAHYLLVRHGYRVLSAAEGTEALRLFEQHRDEIRVVVTDMMMPGLDGPGLLRALRQRDARVPVLGMTGLVDGASKRDLDGFDSGLLLTKPFEVNQLLTRLHEALGGAARTGDGVNS